MKTLIILLFFLFGSSPIYSQLLIENFEYSDGDLLTDHGWISYLLMTNPMRVTSPGLTYFDYGGSNIGNAAKIQETGQNVYKPFSSIQDSGSVYVSMMVNVGSGRNGNETFFASLLQSFTLANSSGRFQIQLDQNGNLAFGIRNNGVFYGAATFSKGVTYVVVVKYVFIPGPDNDEFSLFVFDGNIPVTEPVPYLGPLSGEDLTDIYRLGLFQGTASDSFNVIVDGIYVDNVWNNSVLPVELVSFTSVISDRDVTLNWTTALESNNSGFDIQRSDVRGQTSNDWVKIGNVSDNGTSSSGHSYSFTDRNLVSGKYNYRLKQIDFNGNFEYFALSNEIIVGVPSKFDLPQNYPNPFNPSTKINYDIPFDGKVSITVFDMSGKEVSTLVNDVKTAGYYTINFNASNLSSGIYFYRISVDANGQNFVSTKKMTLIK